MSQQPKILFSYDTTNHKSLMTACNNLSTFADVATWDEQAGIEIKQMVHALEDIDQRVGEIKEKLKQAKKERSEKGFFAKLFDGGEPEKSLTQLMQKYGNYKISLSGLADELQEKIDFTPNSAEEQKLLIKELKARKKELQVEKREIAAEMKAIKREARKESADVGVTHSYNLKLVASQRRIIRYQKEAALHPHEDEKTAIERQIIQVDKDILWAEKFS